MSNLIKQCDQNISFKSYACRCYATKVKSGKINVWWSTHTLTCRALVKALVVYVVPLVWVLCGGASGGAWLPSTKWSLYPGGITLVVCPYTMNSSQWAQSIFWYQFNVKSNLMLIFLKFDVDILREYQKYWNSTFTMISLWISKLFNVEIATAFC